MNDKEKQERAAKALQEGSYRADFNVYDQDGNLVSQTPWEEAKASGVFKNAGDTSLSGSFPLYENNGKYTVAEPTETHISLDEKTGAINVKAPSYVVNSDYYQNELMPKLNTLSANYQMNKNAIYSTEDGKEYTTKDFLNNVIEEMNKDDTIAQFKALADVKNQATEAGFDDWTDSASDIYLFRNSDIASGESNDNSRVVVPLSDYAGKNFFSGMDSFDEATGTVSLADFKKWWNRKEHTDDELREWYSWYSNVLGSDFKSKYGEMNLTADEYARTKALMRVIDAIDPEASFMQKAGDVALSAIEGISEGVLGWVLDISYNLEEGIAGSSDPLSSGWQEYKQLRSESNDVIDSAANTVNTVADLASTLIPMSKVGKVVRAGTGLATASTAAKLTKAVEESEKAAKAFSTAMKGRNTVKALEELEKISAESISGGIKATLMLTDATTIGKTATKAMKALEASTKALETVRVANTALSIPVKIAAFTAESVLQTIVFEPELLRKMFADGGKDSKEALKEFTVQLATDSAVLAGFKTVGAGLKAFSKTTIGSAVNANAAIRLAKLETKLTDIKEAIKTKMTGEDVKTRAINLIEKGETANNANKIRKGVTIGTNALITDTKRELAATEKVRWLGATKEEIQAGVRRVQDVKIGRVEKAQIAIDRYQRSIDSQIRAAIKDSPVTSKAYDDFIDSFSKLVKEDLKAGEKAKKGLLAGGGSTKLLNQDTSNYLGAKHNIAFYENKRNISGLSQSEQRSLEDAKRQYELFTNNASSELIELADNFYVAQQQAYRSFTDYFIRNGLFSADEIDSMRRSGLWGPTGDEYVRQQRIKESGGKFTSKTKKIKGELQKLQAGVGDFADPMVVFSDWMAKNCDKLNRQNVARMIKGNDLVVLADTTQTMATRNASHKMQKAFYKEVSSTIDGTMESMSTKGLFNEMYVAQEGKAELGKAQAAARKADKKLASGATKNYTSTRAERATYIDGMDEDIISDVFYERNGYRNVEEFVNEYSGEGVSEQEVFESWLNDIAPKETKEMIRGRYLQYLETMPVAKSTKSADMMDGFMIDSSMFSKMKNIDDYVDNLTNRVWKYWKENNGGVETTLVRDYDGSVITRATVSLNTESYKYMYHNSDVTKKQLREDINSIVNSGYKGDGVYGDAISGNVTHVGGIHQQSLASAISFDLSTSVEDEIEMARFILGDNMNYSTFKKIIEQDSNLDSQIRRSVIANDPALRDSDTIKEIVSTDKRNEELFIRMTEQKDAYDRINDIQRTFEIGEGYAEGATYDNIRTIINGSIDEVVENAIKFNNGKTLDAVLSVAKQSGDQAKTYLALRAMMDRKTEFVKKIKASAEKEYKQISGKGAKVTDQEKKEFANAIAEIADSELTNRFNNLRTALAEAGSPLVDKSKLFSEINDLKKEIDGYSEMDNVLPLGTRNGEIEYVELDPLTKYLVENNNNYVQSSLSAKGNFLYMQSKLFRLGTTGLRLKSWLMQTARDGIALYSGVGQLHSLAHNEKELREVFGDNVMSHIAQYDQEVYDEFMRSMSKEEAKAAIAKRELEQGYARSAAASETYAYMVRRDYGRTIYGEPVSRNLLDRTSAAIDNLTTAKTIGNSKIANPFALNTRREEYMRQLGYSNAFTQSMKAGYGVTNSRIHAEFIMNNATTNFSRGMVHLGNLQKTVPYLGAAVNGTKSFYRLLSMDPLGVMGRLIGGIMMPTLGLTALSFTSEENRKVYQNIPEYTKKDNICFVVNGQVVTIPIPQEMASIFGVPRMMVEKMYGVNPHNFWELAANNMVGLSPIDLSGFVSIDSSRLAGDPTWTDRLVNGVTKMASQLLTPTTKTLVMLATGRDPYTGNPIDTSWSYVDPDTGETQVMDYKSGRFAKLVSEMFGGNVSAAQAQVFLDNFFGKAGVNFIEDLTALGQGTVELNMLEDATGAFYTDTWDAAQRAWSAEMRELRDMKDAILNSDEYKSANSQHLTDKTSELLAPLYERTLTVTNNLKNRYGAQFTNKKFAAVLSLLNTGSDGNLAGLGARSQSINDELFQVGRNEAIETMHSMGFRGTNDGSIFGYTSAVYEDGKIIGYKTAYRDPMAILALENAEYTQRDIHTANLDAMLDKHKGELNKINDQISVIYDKKKLSNADYDSIDAIKVNWNAKIAAELEPYISKYGVDAVLSNDAVYGVLAKYILVPGDYEVDKRGRYISAPRINKQYAFIKNYLKDIFKEDEE